MKKFILSIDQGTTSSRVVLYNTNFKICDIVQKVYDNKSKFSESALSFIKNLDWQKISLSLSKIYQNSH